MKWHVIGLVFITTIALFACGDKTTSKAPDSNSATASSGSAESNTSTEPVAAMEKGETAAGAETAHDASESHDESSKEKEHASGAKAEEPEAMEYAKKRGCTACHGIDKKKVGPAWTDVAKRYKNDPASRALLIEKVKMGGKGNWTEVTGGAPMPPYSPRVPDNEIEALVDFILTL